MNLFGIPFTNIEYTTVIFLIGYLFSKKETKRLVLAIPLGLFFSSILSFFLGVFVQMYNTNPNQSINLLALFWVYFPTALLITLINSVINIAILFLGSIVGGDTDKLKFPEKNIRKIAFALVVIYPIMLSLIYSYQKWIWKLL